MMCKPICPLNLKRFTFDREKHSLSAFESDLRNHPFDGTYPWLQRIWDDACDVGCFILSHLSGNVEAFYLSHTMTNGEGEVQGWEFRPVNTLANVQSVTIFND